MVWRLGYGVIGVLIWREINDGGMGVFLWCGD
jgi:hypothetical protein